jgi:hypothetical protein
VNVSRVIFAAVAVVVAGFLACGTSQSSADDIQATLQELTAQIDRIIGNAACEVTGQCRVIAVGSKPCGGPWSYRAYSTLKTDVSSLEVTVQRYTDLQKELNQRTGAISDCMFVTEPTVQCVSGRCVTQ